MSSFTGYNINIYILTIALGSQGPGGAYGWDMGNLDAIKDLSP
jgi:hypothetical protein